MKVAVDFSSSCYFNHVQESVISFSFNTNTSNSILCQSIYRATNVQKILNQEVMSLSGLNSCNVFPFTLKEIWAPPHGLKASHNLGLSTSPRDHLFPTSPFFHQRMQPGNLLFIPRKNLRSFSHEKFCRSSLLCLNVPYLPCSQRSYVHFIKF